MSGLPTQLLADNRALIERLADDPQPASWEGFAAPLNDGFEQLGRAWGIVGHLHGVQLDVPEWREAYNEMLPEVSRFYAELGQNLKLFAKYKSIRSSAAYASLSSPSARSSTTKYVIFVSRGAELPGRSKTSF